MPIQFEEFLHELPSLGVCYAEDEMDLIDGNKVKIRPFMAGDVRQLGVTKDNYQAYTALVSQFIREPKAQTLKLDRWLVSDVLSVIYMARIRGVRDEYSVGFGCQSCGAVNHTEVELSSLVIRDANDFANGFVADGLEVELAGCKFEYHLPRMEDEKRTTSWMNTFRAKKMLYKEDTDRQFVRLAQLIDKVDGAALSMEKKFELVQMISMSDFKYFDELISDSDTGVINSTEVPCNKCSTLNKVFVGMDAEFFRAESTRKG